VSGYKAVRFTQRNPIIFCFKLSKVFEGLFVVDYALKK